MDYKVLSVFFLLLMGCKSESKPEEITSNPVVSEKIEPYDLEVYDFDGLEGYLNRSDEKTYVVNFWATWCAPCIKELPHFEKLNKDYQDSGVEVILVSLDFPRLYESKLIPYIQKNDLRSKVVALDDADANSWIPRVDKNWSGAIPATLIYNKDKRKFYEQSFDYEQLHSELNQFLN